MNRNSRSIFAVQALALLIASRANAEPAISADTIDHYLTMKNSPLAGQGGTFVSYGIQYDVDPRLVVAIAGQESVFGTDLEKGAFNAWGWLWNKADKSNSYFASWDEGIHSVTHYLRKSYFDPLTRMGVKPTIAAVGATYCKVAVDPHCSSWVPNVTSFYHTELLGDLTDLGFAPPTPTPTFATKFDLQTGVEPLGLVVADLDGDHKPDIAVTIYNHGNGDHLTIFRNTGSAGHLQFDPLPIDVPTGAGPEGLAAGDLDNDGKVDLVTANQATAPSPYSATSAVKGL